MNYSYVSAGDFFLLVYSVDDDATFQEAASIKNSIFQYREQASKNEKLIPMVFVGNKCDLPSHAVPIEKAQSLVYGIPGCVAVNCSARENTNIDSIFIRLFELAKLPTEMSPSLHRRVTPSYIPSSPATSTKRISLRSLSLRRKLSDVGAVDPTVRRPSLRTEVLTYKTQLNLTDRVTSLNERSKSADRTKVDAAAKKYCVVQ